jgi:hypothetical protein
MNHYIEEVDDGSKEGSVLAEWKAKALMDRAEHMEEYIGRVVRRPLGKIIVNSHSSLNPHHINELTLSPHRTSSKAPRPSSHKT